MEKMRTGYARRVLVAGTAAAILVIGLGLLGYSLLAGGSPVSADTPENVSGKVSEEVYDRFSRDLPERAVEKIRRPRVEAPKAGKMLKLTVPEMERVESVPVYDAPKAGWEDALHDGTVHVRGTGFPWQKGANVYIAGHRVGYPETRSDLVFWDLDKLEAGDEIFLTDAEGKRYTYEVFRKFIVAPDAGHVLRPIKGKNVVSLQTCTLPDYSKRLIVQAELKNERS